MKIDGSPSSTEVIARAVTVLDEHLLVARLRGDSWGFLPGGHVQAGEPLLAALQREFEEELGARLVAADPIGSVEHRYVDDQAEPHHEINHVFDVTIEGIPRPGHEVASHEEWLEFSWTPIARLSDERLRPEPLKRALLHWIDTHTPFNIAHAVQDLGGYRDHFRLRSGEQRSDPITVRHSARALLIDGCDLILFKRHLPGHEVYWTTPGGRVEPSDLGDLQSTLRRELLEELGATIRPAQQVFAVRQQGGGMARVQHFFACRLDRMDLTRRSGEEFHDPARGEYEVVRVPFTREAISLLNLYPEELKGVLTSSSMLEDVLEYLQAK